MITELATKMTLDQKKVLYTKSKEQYYNDPNGKTLMSDAKFDALEDEIRAADPKWKGFKAGAKLKVKKMKVKLDVPMFSLDKTKPETVISWLDHNADEMVVVSDKEDGAALELKYRGGIPVGAYTRGDGIIGGDVSYIIPHLKIPQRVGTSDFILRCEVLFATAKFAKYKHEFDAARNAASGILNRQDIHPAARDMSVVVLQVLQPNPKPSKGLAWAKARGFTVVPFKVFKASQLNGEKLSKLLAARRAKSKYKMDGLVITLDKVNTLPKAGNPSWAVAFKDADLNQDVLAVVERIEWNVSPHGHLKPVAIIRPVI